MNSETKRNIKNLARTGGNYSLKGIKFAGKSILEATEVTAKTLADISKNEHARKFIAKVGTIAACVSFTAPTIALTSMNYIVRNAILNEGISPVDALMSTFNVTEKIMNEVLDFVAVPTEQLSKSVENIAHKGKEALDR